MNRRLVIWSFAALAGALGGCSKSGDRAAGAPDKPVARPADAALVLPLDAAPPELDAAPAGRMHVVYADDDNPYRRAVKEEGVFEQLVTAITASLVLPRDVPVVFTACGQINAFYSRDKHAIVMCDEIVEYFIKAIDERQGSAEDKRKAILGALVFFFLHEVGHALVGELELPAVGREEDAADQVAALVMLGGGKQGAELAGYGADAFGYILELRGGQSAPFWDEHSLDQQRFYNIICLIYGSNPTEYGVLVDKGFLPEPRARRCPREFADLRGAWDKLLAPYVRGAAAPGAK